MSWLGEIIPDGPLKHWLELRKAAFISRFPDGRLKHTIRQNLFRNKPDVDLPYLINSGENVVIVGCRNTPQIELMSYCVGPSARVIIIEPDQNNLKNHYAFIEKKSLANVTVVPKAVFDKKGTAKFLVAPLSMDHRIAIDNVEHDNDYRQQNYYVDAIDVEVDTIDNIMNDIGVSQIGYIQIMINGAEVHALRGMDRILAKTKRIFVKAHARDKSTKEPISEMIIPLLRNRGFHAQKTIPSSSVAKTVDWTVRTGDVFAWKWFGRFEQF